MSLPNGKVKHGGVIIGTWPPFREQVGNHATCLSEVAVKLREQYRLAVNLPAGESNYKDTYPLPRRKHSEKLVSGQHGAIARVIAGAGTIHVGRVSHELEVGAWVFIPHGQNFEFEGRVIAGMNFRVVYANLSRS